MYSGGGEDGKTRSEKNERATRPSKEEKDGIQNGEQSAHNSQQLKRFVPCHAMLCFAMPCHAICVVCLVIRYPFVRAHMCVPVCIDRWCVWCVQRRTMRKTIHQPHDFYNGKRGSTEKNDQIQKKKKQHEQKKNIRYGEATKNKIWCVSRSGLVCVRYRDSKRLELTMQDNERRCCTRPIKMFHFGVFIP